MYDFIGIAGCLSFLPADKITRKKVNFRVRAMCNRHKYPSAVMRLRGFLSLEKAVMARQPDVGIFTAEAGHEFNIDQQLAGRFSSQPKFGVGL